MRFVSQLCFRFTLASKGRKDRIEWNNLCMHGCSAKASPLRFIQGRLAKREAEEAFLPYEHHVNISQEGAPAKNGDRQ